MKKLLFTLFILSSTLAFAQLEASSYDWDDTIVKMPTKIILFNKQSSQPPVEVTTGEFAHIRMLLGKPGQWQQFEMRTTPNSLEYFRTTPQKYFVRDIKFIITQPPKTWMTQTTEDFLKSLETPESAQLVTIVTARGHEREEIFEGQLVLLEYFSKLRGKKYYPVPLKNIIAVGKAGDPSQEKAEQVKRLLDYYARIGVTKWRFLDDDLGNVKKMNAMLEEERNRWPQIDRSVIHVLEDKVVVALRCQVVAR